jgi:hypothetical protein
MMLDMHSSRFTERLIATRGDRLALHRRVFEGSGRREVGPWEVEFLQVSEVDDHGDAVATVLFDPDDLDAAYAELDDRYVAGEAAFRHAKLFGALRGAVAGDWDAMASTLAPDFVVHDHSPLGWGTLDRPAYVESVKALAALAPDSRIRTDHLWLSDRGALGIHVVLGTYEGGAYEQPRVTVSEFDADGRTRRRDIYTLDQLDEARARFAALGARAASDPLRIPPNAATRASYRHACALETRDWVAVEALCAPTLEFDDRRKGVLIAGGRDMLMASGRLIGGARTRIVGTVLATAGDRLALEHTRWIGADDRVPFEMENLAVIEVDAEGRIVAVICFDPDDRRAASAELVDRYARSETSRWAPGAYFDFWRAVIAQDLLRCRAALPDEFVFDDHRRIGAGRLESAGDYVTYLGTLSEQSPDAIVEVVYHVATARHAGLVVGHTFGTLPEGGTFESLWVSLGWFRSDQLAGIELFELEDLDRARARFEALRAGDLPRAS